MTSPQPPGLETDALRPNHSTGPKTPEGKRICSLNAFRHGLTAQICVLTPEEQQAYDWHSKIVLDALLPVGGFERDIAQSIADDRWRLKRARSIESSLFAIGAHAQPADDTGHPQVDDAFAQARTWVEQAHNLQLLTIYEQRIQRTVNKNMLHLKTLQTERTQVANEDMRQAKLLYQLAQAEGNPYRPEASFSTLPVVRESVFSSPEVAWELSRANRLTDAISYDCRGVLPKVAKASAGGTAETVKPVKPPAS